jgi:hypothetical protein
MEIPWRSPAVKLICRPFIIKKRMDLSLGNCTGALTVLEKDGPAVYIESIRYKRCGEKGEEVAAVEKQRFT